MGRNAVSYLVLDQSCNFTTTQGSALTAANQNNSPAQAQRCKAGLAIEILFCVCALRENFSAVD